MKDKLETYRGSLDYAEFVLDPNNEKTEWPGEVFFHLLEYCATLGMSQYDFRKWLLDALKKERRKRERKSN